MVDSAVGRKLFYEQYWQDEKKKLDYARYSAKNEKYPAIIRVWGDLPMPEMVLDFGCGNGVLTSMLKENGFGRTVTGVDISQTAIQQARARYGDSGIHFATTKPCGGTGVQRYDVAVLSHVLEHLVHPQQTLFELIPQAEWFVIEVPLERCLWQDLKSMMRSLPRHENSAGHLNFWTRSGFQTFLGAAGLAVVRDYHYASAPYSSYTGRGKRMVERSLLTLLGLPLYSRVMATHYIVLARKKRSGE